VDVRVVVATHRDLDERVRQGLFRQDLYYRLAVVPIALAPLRNRKEDIPGLCELFCRSISKELKTPPRPINTAAIRKLQHYQFPGNIRELRNLIERALILSAGGEIGPDDFPLPLSAMTSAAEPGTPLNWITTMPESVNLRELLEQMEKGLILRALKTGGGIQAEAARRLQLSRSDLAYKLTKYSIRADSADADETA
jgi:DNA-binding NtrC family response regulator